MTPSTSNKLDIVERSSTDSEVKMDVSGVANLATSMAQNRNDDAVSITVLKKSLDIQTAIASQMIATLIPAPVAGANLPAHLGQNINTVA